MPISGNEMHGRKVSQKGITKEEFDAETQQRRSAEAAANNPPVNSGPTERQAARIREEQEAGARRVKFFEAQKHLLPNPEPLGVADVSTPVPRADDGGDSADVHFDKTLHRALSKTL